MPRRDACGANVATSFATTSDSDSALRSIASPPDPSGAPSSTVKWQWS